MISEDKFLQILSDLRDRTLAGGVKWNRQDYADGEVTYSVRFDADTYIQLNFDSSQSSIDEIVAQFFYKDRNLCEVHSSEDDSGWDIVYPIVEAEESKFYNTDAVLEKVEKVLKSGQPIGQ